MSSCVMAEPSQVLVDMVVVVLGKVMIEVVRFSDLSGFTNELMRNDGVYSRASCRKSQRDNGTSDGKQLELW
jgi:hypothetical protein